MLDELVEGLIDKLAGVVVVGIDVNCEVGLDVGWSDELVVGFTDRSDTGLPVCNVVVELIEGLVEGRKVLAATV